MESKRRSFLKNASFLAGTAILTNPISALAEVNKKIESWASGNTAVVYHTANLNGHVDFNSERAGGLREIKRLIETDGVSGLLCDSGNFMAEHHAPEIISMMNKMGYHAVAIGANELSDGQEALLSLIPGMNFPLINCNYTFSNEDLSSKVKTHTIVYVKKLKIGITAVGKNIYQDGIGFHDPYLAASRMARTLKINEKCDLVICLSNLDANDKTYNNIGLANQSSAIDFIVGQNGSKVMKGAVVIRNANQQEVILSQVGYNGLIIGKTHFGFNNQNERNYFNHQFMIAGSPLRNNPKHAYLALNEIAIKSASIQA